MLVSWMGYASFIAALLACAGLAMERLARAWRIPERLVWALVLGLALFGPLTLAFRAPTPGPVAMLDAAPSPPRPMTASSWRATITTFARPASRPTTTTHHRIPSWARGTSIGALAFGSWIVASTGILVALLTALLRLRSQARHWREVVVDGVSVLVSTKTGPAVIGTLRPRIVIPQWALALDPAKRALMLRHELEHIRSRDPALLRLASLALVASPWNPAIWFIVRRLRQCIETDCDRRVLGAAFDGEAARDYGMLLLLVGARRSSLLATVAPLAGNPPSLERRLRAMTAPLPRRRGLTSTALIAAVAVPGFAATKLPIPPSTRRPGPDVESIVRRPTIVVSRPPVLRVPPSVASLARAIPSKRAEHAELEFRDSTSPPGFEPRIEAPAASAPISGPSPEADAAQQGSTSREAAGRVVDAGSGAPLAHVYVTVVGVQAIGEPNWTCSDANGDFRLRVPIGEAWLSARNATHGFSTVALPASESMATLRGVPNPPADPSAAVPITSVELRPGTRLLSAAGVTVEMTGDTAQITIRTASGATIERTWVRGTPMPIIRIEGFDAAMRLLDTPYVNVCEK